MEEKTVLISLDDQGYWLEFSHGGEIELGDDFRHGLGEARAQGLIVSDAVFDELMSEAAYLSTEDRPRSLRISL